MDFKILILQFLNTNDSTINVLDQEQITVMELLFKGGFMMIPILILFVITIYILIEKILLLFESNKNLINVIENIKPPIFFKKKEFIIFQCKVWNLKLINIILNRLIDLELKCKLNHTIEKTLISQFILSTSVLARNKINS